MIHLCTPVEKKYEPKSRLWLLGRFQYVISQLPDTLLILANRTTHYVDSVLVSATTKFKSISSDTRRYRIYFFLIEAIEALLSSETYETKRSIYYSNVTLFKTQKCCDQALLDIAQSFAVPLLFLHIRTTLKGLLYGPISLHLENDIILSGLPRPISIPMGPEILSISTSVSTVLVLEKDSTFQSLVGIDPNIVLVTGKGYPDVSSRELLFKLSMMKYEESHEFWRDSEISLEEDFWGDNQGVPMQMKVKILVDWDPDGIDIMLCYRHGSTHMALANEQLACPAVEWIGIKSNHIDLLDQRMVDAMIKLSQRDRVKILKLLKRPSMTLCLRRELLRMLRYNYKTELQIATPAFLVNLAK